MKRGAFLLLAGVLTAQPAPEVEITDEPHHHLVFANDQVRVFDVEIAAGSDTLMHWHRRDYVYVMLGATEFSNDVAGKPSVEMKLQDGETRFSPGPLSHLLRVHSQPFRNVTIELLQDDKLRQSPANWDEDRGLEILQGGTQEILFVKDGVRVSEFELQPGATIPKHHHSGPHLLVAVTDLDLRSDVEGQGPMLGHFKSGDTKWLPSSYSHSLTNTGQHLAKFVTLEFP
jgi:quercetin dioxygenase-like cupin family protein